MKKTSILFTCLLSLVLASCQKENKTDYSNESQINTPLHEEPEKRLVGSITVDATIFHVIPNYDGTSTLKNSNKTRSITLNLYDDSSAFLQGGDLIGGWVRYSKLSGYEYECNYSGGDVLAFNYDF